MEDRNIIKEAIRKGFVKGVSYVMDDNIYKINGELFVRSMYKIGQGTSPDAFDYYVINHTGGDGCVYNDKTKKWATIIPIPDTNQTLKDKMLEAIFIKTGGRPENPQIAQICAQIAAEELDKRLTVQMEQAHDIKYTSRKKIKKVIELTAHEDARGEVWGNDIPLGNIEDLVNQAEKILG